MKITGISHERKKEKKRVPPPIGTRTSDLEIQGTRF